MRMRTDVPLDVSAVFNPRVPKVSEDFLKGETKMETETAPAAPPDDLWIKPGTAGEPKPAQDASPVETAAPVAVVEQPAPAEWERGLEPRTMNEACKLAQRLHDSRMFSAYGTPQAVLSTVMLGRELGMPAMAALRSVHIIKGKHCIERRTHGGAGTQVRAG